MVPHTFHDCGGTAVSDTEPFAGYPRCVERSARRAVKHRVPDDGIFMRTEPRCFSRADDDFTACQPFADIVVRLACQPKVHPVATEGTETLPGTACEMTANRPVRQACVAVSHGDVSGYLRAHRAVRIPNVVRQFNGRLLRDGLCSVLQNLVIKWRVFPVIPFLRVIARLGAGCVRGREDFL